MIVVDVEQNTPEWWLAKRGIPSAGSFDKIITAKKGELSSQADDYMFRLLDEIERPDAIRSNFHNVHTERGHELEPRARDWYKFTHPALHVMQVGFVTRDDGLAGCSPDSLIQNGDTILKGLEIKSPDGPTHLRYLHEAVLPAAYVQQVHGSMAITQLVEWDFLSFCPGYDPFLITVQWDEYTEKVAKAVQQFVERFQSVKEQYYRRHG